MMFPGKTMYERIMNNAARIGALVTGGGIIICLAVFSTPEQIGGTYLTSLLISTFMCFWALDK
jgi:hypothetical protein